MSIESLCDSMMEALGFKRVEEKEENCMKRVSYDEAVKLYEKGAIIYTLSHKSHLSNFFSIEHKDWWTTSTMGYVREGCANLFEYSNYQYFVTTEDFHEVFKAE